MTTGNWNASEDARRRLAGRARASSSPLGKHFVPAVILVTLLMGTFSAHYQDNKLSAWAHQQLHTAKHHQQHQQQHQTTSTAPSAPPTPTTSSPFPVPTTSAPQAAATTGKTIHKIPIESIKNVTFIEVQPHSTSTGANSSGLGPAVTTAASASSSSSLIQAASLSSSHQLAGRSAALLVSSLPPPPLSSSARAFLEDALATSASTLSGSISTVAAPAPTTTTQAPASGKQQARNHQHHHNKQWPAPSGGQHKASAPPASTTAKPVKHPKKVLTPATLPTSSNKLRKSQTEAKTSPANHQNNNHTSPNANKQAATSSKALAPSSTASPSASSTESLEQLATSQSTIRFNGNLAPASNSNAHPNSNAQTSARNKNQNINHADNNNDNRNSNSNKHSNANQHNSSKSPARTSAASASSQAAQKTLPTKSPASSASSASPSPSPADLSQLGNLQASGSTPAATKVALTASKQNPRWTHFGARLKPLASSASQFHQASSSGPAAASSPVADHQASNSRSKPVVTSPNGSNNQALGAKKELRPAQDNRIDAADSESEPDDDEEQDSEAMLYNMLQQQPTFNDNAPAPNKMQPIPTRPDQRHATATASNANQLAGYRQLAATSQNPRLMKLMKSYSHIHQVDDADDQPRGSTTPSSAERSIANGHRAYQRQAPRMKTDHDSDQRGQQPDSASSRYSQATQRQNQLARPPFKQPARDRQYSPENSGGDDSGDYPESSQAEAQQSAHRAQARSMNSQQASAREASESGGPGPEEANQPPGGPGGPAEEEEFECPDDGIFADESSGCQSYLVCQSGAQVQQKFQCPLGTLFNNIILTCDFAHNVQCGKAAGAKAGQPSAPNDPNDTIRGPTQASSNQYQQPSSPAHRREFQSNPPPRPQYQQLPQPWQQHYPPSPAQATPQQAQNPAFNARPRQHSGEPDRAYQNGASNSVDNSDNSEDSDGDSSSRGGNSDYDSPEPLIPATLPQSAPRNNQQARYPHQASGSSLLPYKAPPAATPANNQKHSESFVPLQHYQQPHREFQSAHKSQLRPSNYQADPTNAANYNGASVATPVYADRSGKQAAVSNHNQRPLASLPVSSASSSSTSTTATSSGASDAPNSFNLVINHVAKPPSENYHRQQQASSDQSQPSGQVISTNHQQLQPQQQAAANRQPAAREKVPSDHQQTPFRPIRTQQALATPAKQYQQQHPQQQQQNQLRKSPAQQQEINNQQSLRPPAVRPHSVGRSSSGSSATSYQSMASQAKPVHVSESATAKKQASARARAPAASNAAAPSYNRGPTVIDLTNDRQIGVSSDAMNNGLLLIVRHSPQQSMGPLGSAVASSSLSTTHASPVDQFNSVLLQSAGQQLPQDTQYETNEQAQPPVAYAVDPILVRPNSPVDAQLFPNVQGVLSNSQPQAAPFENNHQEHYQKQQQQEHLGQVHPPLAHLEPPRPTLIETTSHLDSNHSPANSRGSSSPMYSTASASNDEPINLMMASGTSISTGSAFETGPAVNSKARGSGSKSSLNPLLTESSSTQSSWLATTQATPAQLNSNSNRQNQLNLPQVTSKRLRAAKAPERSSN